MIQVGGSSIAANSTHDTTFGFVPATVNGRVILNPVGPLDSSWAGLVWEAWVDAVNTIKVRVANVTTSPITPVAQSFTCEVIQDPVS
jgi:hypothetical protein